jgi:iron complex outermembrane recepter protein
VSSNGTYKVEVWGRNVTDKFYLLSVSNLQDTINRLVGMPATYGISLSVRFGARN